MSSVSSGGKHKPLESSMKDDKKPEKDQNNGETHAKGASSKAKQGPHMVSVKEVMATSSAKSSAKAEN